MSKLEQAPISELKPYPRNARKHSKRQVEQIARSIDRFGFTNPVLVDHAMMIIAGHGRVEAAKLLGLERVPILRLSHLSDVDKRAYILADNRLAEKAGWDREILAIELQGLIDLDFNIEIAGFAIAEADAIINAAADADAAGPATPEDETPTPEAAAITRSGDIWTLGRHRLLCGDALQAESYAALMQNVAADLIFTDPPYNVPIDGFVGGNGKARRREFAMASGEMSESEFEAFSPPRSEAPQP